jgi:phosphoglycerate-specific signal transduction histidine kinase
MSLEKITTAFRQTHYLNELTQEAMLHLTAASTAHVCTSPNKARQQLQAARRRLVSLRRTQTAALANIDDAIKSLGGGK